MKFRTLWAPYEFPSESARYLQDGRWDPSSLASKMFVVLVGIACARFHCKEGQPASIAIYLAKNPAVFLFVVGNHVTEVEFSDCLVLLLYLFHRC